MVGYFFSPYLCIPHGPDFGASRANSMNHKGHEVTQRKNDQVNKLPRFARIFAAEGSIARFCLSCVSLRPSAISAVRAFGCGDSVVAMTLTALVLAAFVSAALTSFTSGGLNSVSQEPAIERATEGRRVNAIAPPLAADTGSLILKKPQTYGRIQQ